MTDDPWAELRRLTVACPTGTKCPLCNGKWARIAALVGEIVEDATPLQPYTTTSGQ